MFCAAMALAHSAVSGSSRPRYQARKQLLKFDSTAYHQVMNALEQLAALFNPQARGEPLAGTLKYLWRYRAGDYRILAKILDTELLILVIEISNRKDVYRQT